MSGIAAKHSIAWLAVVIVYSLMTQLQVRLQTKAVSNQLAGLWSPVYHEHLSSGTQLDEENPSWWRNQSFPSWDHQHDTLSIIELIEFAGGVLNSSITGRHLPTAVYMVDKNYTLWTNKHLKRQHGKLWKRMRPSEWLAQSALEYLRSFDDEEMHPWSALQEAIRRGGFPFLAYYKDFDGCNRRNWSRNDTKSSIPIFTLCARVDCDFSFPWPTYETILLANRNANNWRELMSNRSIKYSKKQTMAIWRGSLTGTKNKNLSESLRWNLCKLSVRYPDVLDARLVNIPEWRADADPALVNGIASKMAMEKFQRYAAVVDVDGNAWSSRFGSLLCMDSVVLKIQPKWVDHFFYDGLVPWEHYIPVSSNLTDLIPKIRWVLANPEKTRAIVNNAHDWCAKKMAVRSLFVDVLSTWNSYIALLNATDSNWSQTWQNHSVNSSIHGTEMAKVDSFL